MSFKVNTPASQLPDKAGSGQPGAVQRKQGSNTRETDPNFVLARLAILYKALTAERVKQALQEWSALSGEQDFANFLLAKHYLTPESIEKLTQARDQYLEKQKNRLESSVGTRSEPDTTGPTVSRLDAARARASTRTTATNRMATPDMHGETKKKEEQASVQLDYGPETDLPNLLKQVTELGASDLHVHSGACLRVRLKGNICQAGEKVLTDTECEKLISAILTDRQRQQLEENFQVDFCFEIPGVGRYRANAYKQRRGTDAVFRTIRPKPPSLSELGLPLELKRYTEFHQGMVLFTGPAGCGKSSTMAAMVNLANQSRPDHILTIEDPIEYIHESAQCNINQREAGFHTSSFSKALRAALREDPDIIVIGELRDFETISLALTAAETGHLVMGTLHTSGAIRTVNRLLGVFPPDQQDQLRIMLSESLKVVISQQLVQRADGKGLVPALEVLVNNQATGNLIRESRTFQIKSIMQTGGSEGQILLDASLLKLLQSRVITREEALRHAVDPNYFN